MGGRHERYSDSWGAVANWIEGECLGSQQEQCYDNLRVSNNAWDTNLVKVRSTSPPSFTPSSKSGLSHNNMRLHRSTLVICLSTGKLVVEVPLLSFLFMNVASCPNESPYSGVTPLSCWTPTGERFMV